MKYEIAIETERPIPFASVELVRAIESYMDDKAGFLNDFNTIDFQEPAEIGSKESEKS